MSTRGRKRKVAAPKRESTPAAATLKRKSTPVAPAITCGLNNQLLGEETYNEENYLFVESSPNERVNDYFDNTNRQLQDVGLIGVIDAPVFTDNLKFIRRLDAGAVRNTSIRDRRLSYRYDLEQSKTAVCLAEILFISDDYNEGPLPIAVKYIELYPRRFDVTNDETVLQRTAQYQEKLESVYHEASIASRVVYPLASLFVNNDFRDGTDGLRLTFGMSLVNSDNNSEAHAALYLEYANVGSLRKWMSDQTQNQNQTRNIFEYKLAFSALRMLWTVYRMQRDAGLVLANVNPDNILVNDTYDTANWTVPKSDIANVLLETGVNEEDIISDSPEEDIVLRTGGKDFRLGGDLILSFIMDSDSNSLSDVFPIEESWIGGFLDNRGIIMSVQANEQVDADDDETNDAFSLMGSCQVYATWESFRRGGLASDQRLMTGINSKGIFTSAVLDNTKSESWTAPLPARKHLYIPVCLWDLVDCLWAGQRRETINSTDEIIWEDLQIGDDLWKGQEDARKEIFGRLYQEARWRTDVLRFLWLNMTRKLKPVDYITYNDYSDPQPVYLITSKNTRDIGLQNILDTCNKATELLLSSNYGFKLL